jgi:hypothetical protein
MNKKKSLFIKLGIVLSLLVVNVLAATPGSRCSIRARALGISLTIAGTVSPSGNTCFPSGPIPDIFAPLGTGVKCNTLDELIPPIIRVSTSCPN